MGPFIRDKNKTSKIMKNLLISLFPIVAFTIYKHGYILYVNGKINFLQILYPLIFILIGAFSSLIIEFFYYKIIKKQQLDNFYGIFPGLFLALVLPVKIPIYVLILGSIVASLSKIIFGGFGKNVFNPALIGYIFVVATYGTFFTTNYFLNSYELDAISKATPLTNASMLSNIGNYDTLVQPYGDLSDFFVGTIPGSFGETSALLCLIALVFLCFTKTIKWKIPISYLFTVFIITFSIGRILGQGLYYPLFHLFSGGLMFGAVFMATDPVTSAVTPFGQIIQGIFLGILTVALRFTGVEGVATSILVMNLFVPIMDKFGVKVRFNIMKAIIMIIISFVTIVIVTILLASTKRESSSGDSNFKILEKNNTDTGITYLVTQRGYGGNIKAKVTISSNKIVMAEIISNNETKDKYQMVIDNDYINTLIKSQDNLNDVDTISGATVTTNALKKMLINVMEDYK